MFDRLRAMLIKEFIQVFRDPRMRIVLFVIPALQTVIFGYAVNMDVKHIPTAILDRDNSAESRDLVAVMSLVYGESHMKDRRKSLLFTKTSESKGNVLICWCMVK